MANSGCGNYIIGVNEGGHGAYIALNCGVCVAGGCNGCGGLCSCAGCGPSGCGPPGCGPSGCGPSGCGPSGCGPSGCGPSGCLGPGGAHTGGPVRGNGFTGDACGVICLGAVPANRLSGCNGFNACNGCGACGCTGCNGNGCGGPVWGGMLVPMADGAGMSESVPGQGQEVSAIPAPENDAVAHTNVEPFAGNPEAEENCEEKKQNRMKGKKGKDGAALAIIAGKTIEPEHSNLFVGNLHKDATEEELSQAFSQYGVVTACRCLAMKLTKRVSTQWYEPLWETRNQGVFVGGTRTCALVKMKSVEQAAKVVAAWRSGPWTVKFAEADVRGAKKASGPKAKGRETKKTPCNNLYVKGLPPSITEAHLRATFSKAGKVLEMKIMRSVDHKQDCAALIRMGSLEDAKNAIHLLDGTSPEAPAAPLHLSHYGKDPKNRDNLYVKGLPLDFTKEDLEEIFKPYGVVKRCRILSPPAKALDMAALVQMATVEQASHAMEALDGRPPRGLHEMHIHFAEKEVNHIENLSNNIYVKGLPLGIPDFQLRAVFSKYGKVVRLKVMEPTGENVDCAALVQMSSIPEAQAAVEALNGSSLSEAVSHIKVKYAGKDQRPGCNLYVTGLPLTTKESELRARFTQCGQVCRMRLLSQHGRTEAHALVEMMTTEEASLAIQKLNGSTLQGQFCPTLVVRFATNPVREEVEWTKEHCSPMP
eukprot:s1133_g9.t2